MSGTNAFQVRGTDIEFLRGRWNSLVGKFTDDDTKRDDAFSSIVQQYSGPGRVYHNLSHIKALITLYEEVKNQGGSDAVSFAVWYHDIVYDTHKSDNEENSARLARDGLSRMGAPGRAQSHANGQIDKGKVVRHESVRA